MTQNEYVNKHGHLCPVCISKDIRSTKEVSTDDNYAWQKIECQNCFNQWDDIYTLTGYSLSTAYKLGEKE